MTPKTTATTTPDAAELDRLARREHAQPHAILGAHPAENGTVTIRAMRPAAQSISVKVGRRKAAPLTQIHPAGIFEGQVEGKLPLKYKLEVDYGPGGTFTIVDPYAFLPTVGELDLHLIGEGDRKSVV